MWMNSMSYSMALILPLCFRRLTSLTGSHNASPLAAVCTDLNSFALYSQLTITKCGINFVAAAPRRAARDFEIRCPVILSLLSGRTHPLRLTVHGEP